MKKLRIMWLHSHLTLPVGATNYILQVIRELIKIHTVTVFVQRSTIEFEQLYRNEGIDVIALSKYSTGDIQFWLNFSKQTKNEINILKEQERDYDLVVSSMFPMNIIANSLRLPHLQFCFQPFAFFWDSLLIKKLSIPKRIFLYLLRARFGKSDIEATKKSPAILTINEGSKASISEIYSRDSVPVFMGVSIKNIDTKEIATKYEGRKIILHTTDWTPLKQTSWLIDQFHAVQKKYSDVVLVITETKIDSHLKQAEVKKIENNKIKNIEFLGTISSDLLHQYFGIADIVVYSGFGTAITTSLFVLECMAYETTPIVSKGASEDVEDGKTGLVFNSDSEFQTCMLTLLEDNSMRLTLGKNARDYVLHKHSWLNVAKFFEAECTKLIDKN